MPIGLSQIVELMPGHVHAAGSDLIQVALIGCGGRGTGAANDALSTKKQGPIKLVAMADVFENRLNESYDTIKREAAKNESDDQVDVPTERKFLGFDAYKKTDVNNKMDIMRANSKFDGVKSKALVANVLIPSGAAIMALAGVLLVLDLTRHDEKTPSLGLQPLRGGALLTLRGVSGGL